MKISLRKLATLGNEVKKAVLQDISNLSDYRAVNLQAIGLQTTAQVIEKAEADRLAALGRNIALQAIYAKIRKTIAEGNVQFGVNDILLELRQKEDIVRTYEALFVNTPVSTRARRSGYTDLTEAEFQLKMYRESVENKEERTRGSSEVTFKLAPINEVQEKTKALQKEIKTLKNETLLKANLNEVDLPLTEEETGLLEALVLI